MVKKTTKDILFERMNKIGGMPLHEDMNDVNNPSGGENYQLFLKDKENNKLSEDNNQTNNDPSHDEMLSHLNNQYKNSGFDRFDAEAAIYWFAYGHHNGQSSNLYSTLSTSQYKPARSMNDVADEGEMAKIMYDNLVSTYSGNNENGNTELKEYDNYNYPAGADADPSAPWNQPDPEEVRDWEINDTTVTFTSDNNSTFNKDLDLILPEDNDIYEWYVNNTNHPQFEETLKPFIDNWIEENGNEIEWDEYNPY